VDRSRGQVVLVWDQGFTQSLTAPLLRPSKLVGCYRAHTSQPRFARARCSPGARARRVSAATAGSSSGVERVLAKKRARLGLGLGFGHSRARAQACAVSGKRSQTPLGGVAAQRERWGRACSSLYLVLPFDAARVSVRVNAEGSRESLTRSFANPFGVGDTDVDITDICVHAMRECCRVRVRARCKIYDMICMRWTRRLRVN